MKFNDDGESIIREFEGCRLQAYPDLVNQWTIGFGHSGPDVKPGMVISKEKAEELLLGDIRAFSNRVESIVHSGLNDNQFSAAVCFAYNIREWATTPIFGLLSRGDVDEAKKHWLLYDKKTLGGQKIEIVGLKRRRQAELDLFCKPIDMIA